jgi:hypothetical protein
VSSERPIPPLSSAAAPYMHLWEPAAPVVATPAESLPNTPTADSVHVAEGAGGTAPSQVLRPGAHTPLLVLQGLPMSACTSASLEEQDQRGSAASRKHGSTSSFLDMLQARRSKEVASSASSVAAGVDGNGRGDRCIAIGLPLLTHLSSPFTSALTPPPRHLPTRVCA